MSETHLQAFACLSFIKYYLYLTRFASGRGILSRAASWLILSVRTRLFPAVSCLWLRYHCLCWASQKRMASHRGHNCACSVRESHGASSISIVQQLWNTSLAKAPYGGWPVAECPQFQRDQSQIWPSALTSYLLLSLSSIPHNISVVLTSLMNFKIWNSFLSAFCGSHGRILKEALGWNYLWKISMLE